MSTEELPPRESMEFDVVIVGAGPSGLAAAIRLKQLNADLTIVVVEHPALAKVLKTAFDAIWDTGLTFDQAHDLLSSRKAATA